MSTPAEEVVEPKEPEKTPLVPEKEVKEDIKDQEPKQAGSNVDQVKESESRTTPLTIFQILDKRITYECNNASDMIIDVQGDQRFPVLALISKIREFHRFILESKIGLLSEMSLTAYCLTLIHYFHMANDFVARRGVSPQAEPFMTSQAYTLFRTVCEDAYVPYFLQEYFQSIQHFITENKSNQRFVPTYACFDHNIDFGRMIPTQMFLSAHNLLAYANTAEIASFISNWSLSPMYSIGTHNVYVGNFLTYNLHDEALDAFHYTNWFNYPIFEMCKTIVTDLLFTDRTFTTIEVNNPAFNRTEEVNPYEMLLGLNPHNVNSLTNFIQSLSQVAEKHFNATKDLKSFIKDVSSFTNITNHWYSNCFLPTYTPMSLSDEVKIKKSISPEEFAQAINYKQIKVVTTDNSTEIQHLESTRRSEFSRVQALIQSHIIDSAAPSASTGLRALRSTKQISLENLQEIEQPSPINIGQQLTSAITNLAQMTIPPLVSTELHLFDEKFNKSDHSKYPIENNFSLKANPKSTDEYSQTYKPEKFELLRDYMPSVKFMKPYNSLDVTALSLNVINGVHIESDQIDGFEIPQPNPHTALIDENSMFYKTAIPSEYIYNILDVDHFMTLARVPPRMNQAISVSLYNCSRNEYPQIYAPMFASETEEHVNEAPPFNIIDYTHYQVHCSNRICYKNSTVPHVPKHYFQVWSSYRNLLKLKTGETKNMFIINMRPHFGTLNPLSMSKFPSLHIPN